MMNSYKQQLKKGKAKKAMDAYLEEDDGMYFPISKRDVHFNQKFEKFRKKNPIKG